MSWRKGRLAEWHEALASTSSHHHSDHGARLRAFGYGAEIGVPFRSAVLCWPA